MDGGREKLAAKGEVTSAACGSRNPEMEAERWSVEAALVNLKESSQYELKHRRKKDR